MPRGDRTGPLGMGPMTGRAAGYCAGYPVPGYLNPVGGRAFGGRMGGRGGWGYRHWYYATGLPGWVRFGYQPAYAPVYQAPSPQQEADMLRNQADLLKQQLEAIEKRMAELSEKE